MRYHDDLEVIVRVHLISDNNTLFKKQAIMEPIENIRCRSRPVGLWVLIGTILKVSGVGAI